MKEYITSNKTALLLKNFREGEISKEELAEEIAMISAEDSTEDLLNILATGLLSDYLDKIPVLE